MNSIPSLKQIAANFREDVKVPGWRGIGLPAARKLIYEGRQEELRNYLVGLALANEQARKQIVSAIQSEEQILTRGKMVRQVLRDVQGLSKWPEKTPLRPQTSPGFDREGYRVEHVIIESRPEFYVTAAMYLPTKFKPPFAALLYVLGHSQNGKTNYQRLPANMATKGIAVLVFDPPGQGERDEYVDIATGQRTIARACPQHACAGEPALLTGSNIGAYRIWDSMRCIDYLQSREDIVAYKIGISGTSGGGWESLWVGAIDQRIAAINTNCYTTTFLRRIENRAADDEPDTEQDPFGLLSAGLDMADLYMACYPRPISMGATLHDFFPYDGAMAVYNEAHSYYVLGKKEDRISLTVSDAAHENTPAMRQQTYRWMLKWLKADPKPDESETPDWKNEDDATLFATMTGIVLTSLGGKTSAQLNAEFACDLAEQRKSARSKPDWITAVPDNLKNLLKLPDHQAKPEFREINNSSVGPIAVTEFAATLPGGLTIGGHLWKPADAKSAVIYISPKPKNYDPSANDLCKRLAGQGSIVFDFDPRGMGPMDEIYLQFVPLIQSTLSYDASLLGKPILGMRVSDVLLAVDWLVDRENIKPDQITLHGKDYGALLAIFAACVDKRIGAVIEEQPLTSYSSLCWNRSYAWPVDMIVPGVLKLVDLEEIRSSLAPRPLTVRHPLDHLRQPLSESQSEQAFALVTETYENQRAIKNLSIVL